MHNSGNQYVKSPVPETGQGKSASKVERTKGHTDAIIGKLVGIGKTMVAQAARIAKPKIGPIRAVHARQPPGDVAPHIMKAVASPPKDSRLATVGQGATVWCDRCAAESHPRAGAGSPPGWPLGAPSRASARHSPAARRLGVPLGRSTVSRATGMGPRIARPRPPWAVRPGAAICTPPGPFKRPLACKSIGNYRVFPRRLGAG